MTRPSNRQIVKQLKEGDLRGCRVLVEVYQDRLLTEAVRVFCLPRPDAEELVNDVLLAVVQNVRGFDFKKSDADFHFWVMRIFRNRVRDFVRRQTLTAGLFHSFDESAFEDEERFSPVDHEVISTIVRDYEDSLRGDRPDGDAESPGEPGNRLEIIADVLEKLESWERVLLRCRALEVPYEEIARYTGKPVNQLKVYHARVKKKFVKLLQQCYPEMGK